MSFDVNKIANYNLYANSYNQNRNNVAYGNVEMPKTTTGAEGANTFTSERVGGTTEPQITPAYKQQLDPQMLADKKVAFENGLGGTNNPDDHKLFYYC